MYFNATFLLDSELDGFAIEVSPSQVAWVDWNSVVVVSGHKQAEPRSLDTATAKVAAAFVRGAHIPSGE